MIHSKYFPVLKGVLLFNSLVFHSTKITRSLLQVFLVNSSIILQQAALLTSVKCDKHSFQTTAVCGE